ncbi:MAG: RagB/SusD family nutrient uptake outer membrane protein [Bacteroidales bacterium]|nr:RagB/SusD family nutrient uptake outer membrane protein [Bacteroidales bacterium]
MKKILYIITVAAFVAFAAFGFTSCERWLDEPPSGHTIPVEGDVEAFNRLLNNLQSIDFIFMDNNRISPLAFLSDYGYISDIQLRLDWLAGGAAARHIRAHLFMMPYENPNLIDYFWNWGFFRGNSFFNVVIDGVNDVRTPETEELAKTVIAQATVARAWNFFNAALIYGPAFNPNGDNSTRIIPLRTQSSPTAPMVDLSTTQEVFDFVLAEIYEVLPDMPANIATNARFGRVSTYTLLGEIHLWKREWATALYYFDNAVELAAQQRGGMQNLFYDMNLWEWAIPAQIEANPDLRLNMAVNQPQTAYQLNDTRHREILLFRNAAGGGAGPTMMYPSNEFIALFDSTTDLRREFFFFENPGRVGTHEGVAFNDGRRMVNRQAKKVRTAGYCFPELLLMRAEARARTGDLGGALDDLNFLRQFRHITGTPPLSILGFDDIMQEIINERRRELNALGHKRALDMKRLALDVGRPWSMQTFTRRVGNQYFTGNIGGTNDGEHFTLRISNTILLHNPQWNYPKDTRPWSNMVVRELGLIDNI